MCYEYLTCAYPGDSMTWGTQAFNLAYGLNLTDSILIVELGFCTMLKNLWVGIANNCNT